MIEDILKNSSLKNTRQRSNILKIIASSHKPVTAEEIFEILKSEKTNINLSTIYRTLNILCHCLLLSVVLIKSLLLISLLFLYYIAKPLLLTLIYTFL